MRKILAVLALLVMALGSTAFATNYSVINWYSGWYDSTGFHDSANNNYFSGIHGSQYNNFFIFDLAGVSGAVTGASFTINTYEVTAPGTYTVYATSLTPAVAGDCTGCMATYNALTSGTALGSVSLDSSNSNAYVTLALNAAGLAWLQANEGGQIVLGGSFPAVNDGDFAFGSSDFDPGNHLDINTVPEPGTLVMFGSAVVGLAGIARRKFNV